MNWRKSILFNCQEVDDFNDWLSDVRPYLFFATGYSPKALDMEDLRYDFWIAITNAYGLFKDCAHYMNKKWLHEACNHGIIDQSIEKGFLQYIEIVCAFRSIFCHNQDSNLSMLSAQQQLIMNFLDVRVGGGASSLFKKPFYLDLSPNQWEELLEWFCKEADRLVAAYIDGWHFSGEREHLIIPWCSAVARWYSRANFIYVAAKDYDEFSRAGQSSLPDFQQRFFWSWFKANKERWTAPRTIETVIYSFKEPAYPMPTMYQVITRCSHR